MKVTYNINTKLFTIRVGNRSTFVHEDKLQQARDEGINEAFQSLADRAYCETMDRYYKAREERKALDKIERIVRRELRGSRPDGTINVGNVEINNVQVSKDQARVPLDEAIAAVRNMLHELEEERREKQS